MSNYDKPFMSITELTKIGLSRNYLNDLSHAEGSPIIRTMGNGKILFVTSKLDDFMQEVSNRKAKRLIRK